MRELSPLPPPDVFWSPRLAPAEGQEKTVLVHVTRSVRQRGSEVSTLALSAQEEITLVQRVTARENGKTHLRVSVAEADITVDPPVEVLEEELRQTRLDTVLRVTLDGLGRVERASRVRRTAGSSEVLDGPGKDLIGVLQRIWPVIPSHPVQVGDGWPFRTHVERPLPGGGEAIETLSGRYHFLGVVPPDLGTAGPGLAVVGLDYEMAVSGPRRGAPRLSGTGMGRGVFLLDLEKADVLRAQVIETLHVQVDWPSRRAPRRAEQWTRGFYEASQVGGAR